jgi:hypothetical protein
MVSRRRIVSASALFAALLLRNAFGQDANKQYAKTRKESRHR